jgi:hypothetical protein
MAGEAMLQTLRHVWLVLQSTNFPAAVVGGIAMAAWKYVRATRDIDLLISIDTGHLEQLLERLAEAGIRTKSDPPLTPLGHVDVIPLLYEPPGTFLEVQIDILVARSEYCRMALQRRIATQLPDLDIKIAVLACEDVILHKLLAGRIIDRADSAALLRANRKSLDLEYLHRWAGNLEIGSELEEIWDEVFPGEPMPVE